MKRYFKFLLLALFSLVIIPVDAVQSTASIGYDLTENACSQFQEKGITISGDTYFGRCMQATCEDKSWKLSYYSTDSVSCSNGNLNPYKKVTKSGCSKYENNSCSSTSGRAIVKYCTTITYFDCDRTTDGSTFKTTKTTSKTTRKPTTSTTTSTTTISQKDSNTYLSSLSLSSGSLQFNKEVKEYSISVESTISFITVDAIPEAATSVVNVSGNSNLVAGSNKIVITVTAEDGSVGNYVINVTKKETLSSNANLSSLTIKGYDIDFKNNIYTYQVTINSESTLEVEATTEDKNAIYMVEGNSNLKKGSVIKVIVTAEDGKTMQEYSIHVLTETKKSNSGFIIVLIIILIAAGAVGGFYFFTKKKNGGEKEYEYE